MKWNGPSEQTDGLRKMHERARNVWRHGSRRRRSLRASARGKETEAIAGISEDHGRLSISFLIDSPGPGAT